MAEEVRETTEPAALEARSKVYDTPGGEAYVIEVPIGGLTPDEIVIEVAVDTVTVTTEPKARPDSGQAEKPISRIFEFPREIDPDNTRVSLQDERLKIEVPKAVAARRRIIRAGRRQSDFQVAPPQARAPAPAP